MNQQLLSVQFLDDRHNNKNTAFYFRFDKIACFYFGTEADITVDGLEITAFYMIFQLLHYLQARFMPKRGRHSISLGNFLLPEIFSLSQNVSFYFHRSKFK